MWFAEDKKLLHDICIDISFHVADLKALVHVPTQEKARRGSMQGSGDLLVSGSNTHAEAPSWILEWQRKGSTKDTKPPNPKEAIVKDLMHMQKSSRTNPMKLETIIHAIHNHLEQLYVWGCEPLDDVDGRKVKALQMIGAIVMSTLCIC